MSPDPGSPSSLEEVKTGLAAEFRRVAQNGSAIERSKGRRLGLLLAVIALVVPAGLAVAELVDDGGTGFEADSVPREQLGPPTQEGTPGNPAPEYGDTWVVTDPEPAAVASCRSGETPAIDCGLVLAIDDGAVRPGTYTPAELEAAVRAAGYRWSPAE